MKKLYLTVIFSMFLNINSSYAIIDALALVQTGAKYYQEAKQTINEATVFKQKMENTLKSGFSDQICMITGKCNTGGDNQLDAKPENKITDINTIDEFKNTDFGKESEQKIFETTKNYQYEKGKGNDIARTRENRMMIDGILSNDIATLFAKSVSARQMIREETGELYKTEFKNNNIEEVLHAQMLVVLESQKRTNRILELKAYMTGVLSTAGTTQYVIDGQK